jgi:hypothetical protein
VPEHPVELLDLVVAADQCDPRCPIDVVVARRGGEVDRRRDPTAPASPGFLPSADGRRRLQRRWRCRPWSASRVLR